MAILWERRTTTASYQIRSAGRSLRLYKNGVFHTQYHPDQLFTGGVWDLLSLPVLLYPAATIKRVLVLGVAGGTALHQIHHLCRPEVCIGIELDKVHLRLGKRFFGLRRLGLQLVQGEAKTWLSGYRGPGFDLIVDDIFTEVEGEPVRAIEANPAWFKLLLQHLQPRGMLVQNHPALLSLQNSAGIQTTAIRRQFTEVFSFCTPHYENHIGVFCRQATSTRFLRQRLAAFSSHEVRVNKAILDFTIRRK